MARTKPTTQAPAPAPAPADNFPTLAAVESFTRPGTRKPAEIDPRYAALAATIVEKGEGVLSLAGLTEDDAKKFGRKIGAAIKAIAPGRRIGRYAGTLADGTPALRVTVAAAK